ncbi:hypothetical protein WQE_05072 [Paraburkholderia hospita]|uniref:Uncharacterized protein n=2 Tax=Paraburkholderia hospita TaxID=169430 RepID=A0ABN0FTU8_9BURK|nr:hypothetical protein WQE_05072 [Paraburkholderia hospita]
MALDERERQELLGCLREHGEEALSEKDFRDVLWQLLEDVPGFEMPDDEMLEKLLGEMWERYLLMGME